MPIVPIASRKAAPWRADLAEPNEGCLPTSDPVTSFCSLVTCCGAFKVGVDDPRYQSNDDHNVTGLKMDEFLRFVSRSERERVRLIREARAMYESIFPPADPVSELRDKAPAMDSVRGANAQRGEGAFS